MLSFLPATLRGVILVSLYFLNTLTIFSIMMPFAIAKLLIPIKVWRDFCSLMLKWIAMCWVGINSFNTRMVNDVEWDVQGLEGLRPDQWCLVIANHQSWTDILVLQTVFFRRIPFLKFFLKKELIWVPFLGIAWWALDFPFMKRYSKSFLKKHPELAGKDLETTKKACEKFRSNPVSVMNFVEGTRFNPEKHSRQESPFKRLLKPKAGGVGFVLAAMGDQLNSIVNVTIAYPGEDKSFWDFMCGRVRKVAVRVDTIPVTAELQGDYFGDEAYRDQFQKWVNDLWVEKDELLQDMLSWAEDPVLIKPIPAESKVEAAGESYS